MKRTFVIEWDEKLGSHWMNDDNLQACLSSSTHVGEGLARVVQQERKNDRTVDQLARRIRVFFLRFTEENAA